MSRTRTDEARRRAVPRTQSSVPQPIRLDDALGGDLTKITPRDIGEVEIDTDAMVMRVRLARTFGTQEIAYVEELPIGHDVENPHLLGLRSAVTDLYARIAAAISDRAVEKNGEIPCATCTGACCRDWRVSVTPHDKTIVPNHFIQFVDDDPNGNVGYMRQVVWDNPMNGDVEEAACAALGEDGLCTIYEQRPTICREFSAYNCEDKEEWPDVPKKRRLKVVR